jgi:hypothetical protein
MKFTVFIKLLVNQAVGKGILTVFSLPYKVFSGALLIISKRKTENKKAKKVS